MPYDDSPGMKSDPNSNPKTSTLIDDKTKALLVDASIAVICTTNENGTIHADPVWFTIMNNEIVFGSHEISPTIKNLKRNPKVTVSIDTSEQPNKSVLVYGTSQFDYDDVTSKRIAIFKKYTSQENAQKWVEDMARKFKQVIVRINPEQVSSWD